MFGFLKRLFFGLAVLGGSLILLFWVLNQLRAHAPAPISTAAAKVESMMQPG
jgi:hypothetical protein